MSETFIYDNLFAGNVGDAVAGKETLLAGQNRKRGDVLGMVTVGAATAAFTGTGNGTLTLDATTPLLAGVQAGAYKAVCITAGTDAATFRVSDPKGNVLGDVALGATFANQLKFVIADGSTDFTVGATFTITVAAGSGKLKLINSANVDGSSKIYAILAEDCDATSADKACVVYYTGEFNQAALTFGGSDTYATHKVDARRLDIFFKPAVSQ